MLGARGASGGCLNARLHGTPRGGTAGGIGTDGGVVGAVMRNGDSGPRRLRGLPRAEVRGRRVPVAISRRARLLGLALLDQRRAGSGLMIPGCRSVHTFGMRFPLDLVFLDFNLLPVSLRRSVPPGRIAIERHAQAVLELPAGAIRGES
jgi:uncharacterized protein